MGLFLALSAVVDRPLQGVIGSLSRFATDHGGGLTVQTRRLSARHSAAALEDNGHTTFLYPHGFSSWDLGSEHVSRELDAAVLSLHIHDGDFWMYSLYQSGVETDHFNPLPDYWEEDLEDDEIRACQGDAERLTALFPSVSQSEISRYLVRWEDRLLEAKERLKAYPHDLYYYGDDWQLLDFMTRLGLPFPMNEDGEALGTTCKFHCRTLY